MLTKVYTLGAIAIAGLTIHSAYCLPSAFVLRKENQSNYAERRGTRFSGAYIGGYWRAYPSRDAYSDFRGGGLGSGK